MGLLPRHRLRVESRLVCPYEEQQKLITVAMAFMAELCADTSQTI